MEKYAEEFKNKRVLITGGSRGIGKAISKELHRLGAAVTVIGKNAENLGTLRQECPSIKTVCVDLVDWEATRKALEGLPVFDILINNAGTNIPENFLDASESSFDLIMGTNLKAAFNVSQLVAQKMIKSGAAEGKVILNVSSSTSTSVSPYAAVYSCSKAALDMLTKIMALDLGPHGIRVNSVNPGSVVTDLTTQGAIQLGKQGVNLEELFGKFVGRTPLMSNGPSIPMTHVLETVLFLISSNAGSITGQRLVVDNGYSVS